MKVQAARTAPRARTAPLNLGTAGKAIVGGIATQATKASTLIANSKPAKVMAIGGKMVKVDDTTYSAAISALVSDYAEGVIDAETLSAWCNELIVCNDAAIISDACCLRFFA